MPQPRLLDTESLRALLGPRGQWATESGSRVRSRRRDLKWSLALLADLADTDPQTISRIETGIIVPRDYLKAAIANALATEIGELWKPIRRADLVDLVP